MYRIYSSITNLDFDDLTVVTLAHALALSINTLAISMQCQQIYCKPFASSDTRQKIFNKEIMV